MLRSDKFNLVKYYYVMRVWNIARVRNAVTRNYITQEEFKEITGIPYA